MMKKRNQFLIDAERKRVLCAVRWPLGGIRSYLLYNYPFLLEKGFNFTFVGPADDSFRSFQKEILNWRGVEFEEVPVGKERSCRLWLAVRRQLRTGRFALVHSQGFTAAFHCLIAGIGIRVPQVVTVHDVIRSAYFGGLSGPVKSRVFSGVLSRADAIISVSEDVKQNILEYSPSLRKLTSKLVTIPHGIDLRRLDAEGDPPWSGSSLRVQLGLAEDVFLIGFLGRFMEQKGFLPLLDALEILRRMQPPRPYHLLAVGTGDYVREYRREAARRGLAGVVSFQDAVANAAPILRQLDLLVMPSLWEAAGLLAMEALALGIPVLGSNCIGLREVLHGTPSVTVPAGDAQALSESLREAITKPWVEQARSFAPTARARFNGERASRSLLETFEKFSNK